MAWQSDTGQASMPYGLYLQCPYYQELAIRPVQNSGIQPMVVKSYPLSAGFLAIAFIIQLD
jgi:hypothetical protein